MSFLSWVALSVSAQIKKTSSKCLGSCCPESVIPTKLNQYLGNQVLHIAHCYKLVTVLDHDEVCGHTRSMDMHR